MNGEIAITVIATGFPVMTTAEASKGTYVITLVHSLISSFMPEINCFEEFVNSYSLHQFLAFIDSFCSYVFSLLLLISQSMVFFAYVIHSLHLSSSSSLFLSYLTISFQQLLLPIFSLLFLFLSLLIIGGKNAEDPAVPVTTGQAVRAAAAAAARQVEVEVEIPKPVSIISSIIFLPHFYCKAFDIKKAFSIFCIITHLLIISFLSDF